MPIRDKVTTATRSFANLLSSSTVASRTSCLIRAGTSKVHVEELVWVCYALRWKQWGYLSFRSTDSSHKGPALRIDTLEISKESDAMLLEAFGGEKWNAALSLHDRYQPD